MIALRVYGSQTLADLVRRGFAIQLTSVRYLGRFMPDPRHVPAEVAEYLAEHWGSPARRA